jgi:hypothetical protein
METYNKVKLKSCKVCATTSSESWTLAFDDAQKIQRHFSKQACDVDIHAVDWICSGCENSMSHQTETSPDRVFVKQKVTEALTTIRAKGYVTRRDVIAVFKSSLAAYKPCNTLYTPDDLLKSFENQLTSVVNKCDDIGKYSESKYVTLLGTVYYEKNKITLPLVQQMYTLMCKKEIDRKQLDEWTRLH